ncbi:Protein SGT1-like B isoform D [Glycine soja]|uniref:Protein SGT1-like B isoform C n=1 Tax=Glycine soja TaxID=3848 RepID=A0A445GK11_GLYSO|nr:Protein SGT1-like B isoform C [Glycine soja]RZB61567.1 Protein SGT1-like B isoform D [Glycine soja]
MASDLEAKAKEAFVEDHFELAVDLLSQAIHLEPNKAELYADRAQANIKLNNFTEAVADANKAIELNSSLPKAYLRKGTACMKLEEYETAKAALEVGASLSPDNSRFATLIKECDKLIAEESYTIPIIEEKTTTQDATPKDVQQQDDLLEKPTVAVTKPKYRHEFYQKPDQLVVTIFAKKIPKESITVDFGEQILSVSINVPGEDVYAFQPRLFGKIVPSNCRYEVLSTKIEIRLAKAEPIHWTSLEFTTDIVVPQRVNASSGDLRFILILEFPSSVCSSISCLVTLVKCYINDSRYNANKTYVKCYINDSRYNANKTWVKCYINDNRYNANESLACIYH